MHRCAAPLGDLQFLDRQEHFLPFKPAALQEKMLKDPRLTPRERILLAKLFEMIAQRFHMEFRAKLEHLKTVYEPFDPDLDTQVRARQAGFDEAAGRVELSSSFEQLLLDANFQEMRRDQIAACAEYQPNRSITVKASFSDCADLRVFYRGVRQETRSFRRWNSPWRNNRELVHVFARLALLVRMEKLQPQAIFLKLFKNVVAEDIEMLLPSVRIHMKPFDQLKIGTSVVGGLATASWKAWTAAALSPWVLLALGAGFGGACFKGVTDFVASKTRYIEKLMKNLYFQNLANNSSMIAQVIDSAESERCKELLLAYFVLYVERNRDFTRDQLDRRTEEWLSKEFGLRIDFDISDAVDRLMEKGLVVERKRPATAPTADEAILKVYDLPSALHRLDDAWEECLETGELLADADHRLADADWPPYKELSA